MSSRSESSVSAVRTAASEDGGYARPVVDIVFDESAAAEELEALGHSAAALKSAPAPVPVPKAAVGAVFRANYSSSKQFALVFIA